MTGPRSSSVTAPPAVDASSGAVAAHRYDVAVITSTYPRHARDFVGSFLADLCTAIPLQLVVVCPDDPLHDRPNSSIRRFRHAGVFYGAGAIANLRERGLRPLAVAAAVANLLIASLRATRESSTIWSHWALPSGLVGALCRLVWRRRHVLLLHSADVWMLERLAGGRLLARFIASQTDEVFAVSAELGARFSALTGRSVQVLGCGVRPNPFERTASRAPRVGLLSRLVPSKGALALARRRHELQAALHIAGTGPESAALETLGAAAPPQLHGALTGDAKLRFLADLDVFVAPYSRSAWGQSEGLPVAVLEALAAGCPVVAFESAVPAGLVTNGENGWLVADGDFDALIERTNAVLADPAGRARMSASARQRAADYRLDRVAARWTAVLQSPRQGLLTTPGSPLRPRGP
jgi:glycosyltransferase involved in cell wall biosynthesis